jgi:hypothetical protein
VTALSFNPLQDPGALDVLVAGGRPSPGLFILGDDAAAREYNWDIKKAPGVQGVFMTYRGWVPTENMPFIFQFWEEGQIEEFYNNFLPMFELDALKFNPRPVLVSHPILAANNITQVVAKRIGPLTGNAGNGWRVRLIVNEFRTARIVPASTPSGATSVIGKETAAGRLRQAIAAESALAERPL